MDRRTFIATAGSGRFESHCSSWLLISGVVWSAEYPNVLGKHSLRDGNNPRV